MRDDIRKGDIKRTHSAFTLFERVIPNENRLNGPLWSFKHDEIVLVIDDLFELAHNLYVTRVLTTHGHGYVYSGAIKRGD